MTSTENLQIEGSKIEKDHVNNWDNIGYHRITGGLYFMFSYIIMALVVMLLLPMLVPYSESLGMYNTVTTIFKSAFTFADFGLASALSRYIAEYKVKDPKRTKEYIRFFIWFQSFTGLIQTTVVSIIGIYFLDEDALAHLPWVFVFHSLVQFPGWLGVFNQALKGFQRFDKVAIVGMLNMFVFQIVALMIGSQVGLYFGGLNPAIGKVMGVTIGITIGYYLDDFTATIISGYIFAKISKELGWTMREMFTWDVSKEVMKESLKFGIGVMTFVFSSQAINTVITLIYTRHLPNYAGYTGLLGLLGPFINMAALFNSIHIPFHAPAIAEAHHNGKKNYAEYIMSNAFRTTGQFTGMVVPLVLVVVSPAVETLFPQHYGLFSEIFLIYLLYSIFFQHSDLMTQVLVSTDNHKFNVFITVLEHLIKLAATLIFVRLQLGIWVIIYSLILATLFKQIIGWIYINKKIVSMHFNPWQMWIVPLLAGTITYFSLKGILMGLSLLLPGGIMMLVNFIIIVILAIYITPGPTYFFFLGLFGGYCDPTLEDFKNAVELAGPSKFMTRPWYKFAALGSRISPLHGRFPMFNTNVSQEIQELMELKAKNYSKT